VVRNHRFVEVNADRGRLQRRHDRGPALRDVPSLPEREIRRPNAAPAYYLGRPAGLWITAMRPRRDRTVSRYFVKAAISGA
jgi:hypothetical protein